MLLPTMLSNVTLLSLLFPNYSTRELEEFGKFDYNQNNLSYNEDREQHSVYN